MNQILHADFAANAERRQSERRRVLESGVIFTAEGSFDCQVVDFSSGGVRVRPVEPLPESAVNCQFQLARMGVFECEIRWRAGDAVGIGFRAPESDVKKRCGELL